MLLGNAAARARHSRPRREEGAGPSRAPAPSRRSSPRSAAGAGAGVRGGGGGGLRRGPGSLQLVYSRPGWRRPAARVRLAEPCVRRSALMGYCLVHARVLGPAGPASRSGGGAGEVEAGGGGDREAQERRHPPRAPPASRRPEEEANLRAAGPGARWRRENFNRLLGRIEKEKKKKEKTEKKIPKTKKVHVFGGF